MKLRKGSTPPHRYILCTIMKFTLPTCFISFPFLYLSPILYHILRPFSRGKSYHLRQARLPLTQFHPPLYLASLTASRCLFFERDGAAEYSAAPLSPLFSSTRKTFLRSHEFKQIQMPDPAALLKPILHHPEENTSSGDRICKNYKNCPLKAKFMLWKVSPRQKNHPQPFFKTASRASIETSVIRRAVSLLPARLYSAILSL